MMEEKTGQECPDLEGTRSDSGRLGKPPGKLRQLAESADKLMIKIENTDWEVGGRERKLKDTQKKYK